MPSLSAALSCSLVHCERGGVAITFAISSIAMLAIGGGAVDFARFHSTKTELRKAADAAVLAAASMSGVTDDRRITEATTIFTANYRTQRFEVAPVVRTEFPLR